MEKSLLSIFALILVFACGGVKKTQEALNTGNYTNAINKALYEIADNKSKKNNQPYIQLLEEAFKKNTAREVEHIAFLEKDGNPANYEAIYTTYTTLKDIQERIRPLLPLQIFDENRNAIFSFINYDNDIVLAKTRLSEYLYAHASDLLKEASGKYDYRKAYDDFQYLNEINPGYADTKQKMEEAYAKGLDYVKVQVVNDTEKILPQRLADELLNFNTYGLEDQWTQYHTNPLENIKYQYQMEVSFKDILISPEQIQEKQLVKEKQIKDGYKYLYDNDGNVVKDSLGNKIQVDNFKTVTCSFYQFTQHKSAQVTGNVRYTDLETRQQLNSYPLSSEFVFQHIYASYDGDKRALDNDLIAYLNVRAVPFPSNEQMVYDAGEDLKLRLKNILVQQKFR